jgi:Carboxypeptidase regulatory-like domain
MRNSVLILCLLVGPFVGSEFCAVASAQDRQIHDTTMCAVMHDPAAFAGKLVRLHATIRSGFELSTIVDEADSSCQGPWLEYAHTSGQPESYAFPDDVRWQRENPVFLVDDSNLKVFQDALNARVYSRIDKPVSFATMGGYKRYQVSARMTCRVDYAGNSRNGFGQMSQWRVRFVLVSVENVTTHEFPYDWSKYSRTPGPFPHGTLHGRVVDAQGKAVARVEVQAIAAQGKVSEDEATTYTNNDGSYSLNVQPGKYVVVANRTTAATPEAPFLATYYPSVEDRASGTPLNVAESNELTGIDIRMHSALKPFAADVQVLDIGGKPVPQVSVFLTERGRNGPVGVESSTNSDAEGHAHVTGFEDVDYVLWADSYREGSALRCAPLVHLHHGQAFPNSIVVKISLNQAQCDEQSKQALDARGAALSR